MQVGEVARLYRASVPHLQAFIRWALGTAARPEAIIDLRSEQVEWVHGIMRLNPEGENRTRNTGRWCAFLSPLSGEVFEGWLVQYRGRHVESVKTAWRAAVRRSGLDASCRPYSLRHTVARWMRMHGVSADEVAQQLGHRKLGITGVYTEYDPQYLSAACRELDNLLKAVLRHGLLAKYLPEDPGSCRSAVVEHSLAKGGVARISRFIKVRKMPRGNMREGK